MPPNLDTLPFDCLFVIISYLAVEDVVRIGKTCKQLELILKESTLCRRAVETSACFSLEAQLARSGRITYQDALQRIYLRRSAFSAGDPYAACVIARGTQFIYEHGVLCTLLGDEIIVRDLHHSEQCRIRVCVNTLRRAVAEKGYADDHSLQLLHCCDGVLSIALDNEEEHLLIAIDVSDIHQQLGTLLLVKQLEAKSGLFVRNDSRYLYYGTHSRLGSRGHHEWVIRGVALRDAPTLEDNNHIQLENFVGSEIGATVSFRIHSGYFYAISNQTSFTVEEVDWTSLYTVARFPLSTPTRKALEVNNKIFRREHAEGPIHDSWTSIGLQLDERTSKLIIVESRREWLNGGGTQSRTFYTQPIWFQKKDDADEDAQYPEGDVMVNVLDSNNHAHYLPSVPRLPIQVHEEDPRTEDQARAFILAKTKFRGYNLSCSTFVDLVEDPDCCNDSGLSSCLRLRMGSRRDVPLEQAQKINWELQAKLDAPATRAAARRLYRYSRIGLWPPPANESPTAGLLHKIMNPSVNQEASSSSYRALQISGVSDERSLAYMVRPSRPQCESDQVGSIVLVAFDPFMRLEPYGGEALGERLVWRR